MNSIYGEHLPEMNAIADEISRMLENGNYEHIRRRIKSEESMRNKCRLNHLPENERSALESIHDAIGFRIICHFIDEVYDYAEMIRNAFTVTAEKDYIRNCKPNGYRSYHMIVRYKEYYVEFQLRTIAMDTWASLEHEIKYKKELSNPELIGAELKRCADELASCDISMQVLRKKIQSERQETPKTL